MSVRERLGGGDSMARGEEGWGKEGERVMTEGDSAREIWLTGGCGGMGRGDGFGKRRLRRASISFRHMSDETSCWYYYYYFFFLFLVVRLQGKKREENLRGCDRV